MFLKRGKCLEDAAADVAGKQLIADVSATVSLQLLGISKALVADLTDVRPQLSVVHGLVSTECRRERVTLGTQSALEQLLAISRPSRRLLHSVLSAVTI